MALDPYLSQDERKEQNMARIRLIHKSLLLVMALVLMTFALLFAAPPKIEALPACGVCTIYYQGYIDGPVIGENGTHCDCSPNVWGAISPYWEQYNDCDPGN